MHRDRIETIIKFSSQIPNERFDLSTWAGSSEKPWGGKQDLSCGTVGCIMGFSATIPEFQALGLHLEFNYITSLGLNKSPIGHVVFEDQKHFSAVAKFLDIPVYTAEYLFGPDSYENSDNTTKQEVIERISAFLNEPSNANIHYGDPVPNDEPEEEEEYNDDDDDIYDSNYDDE